MFSTVKLEILTFISLKTTLEDKDLVRDVQQTFSAFGPCHVKIKRDKRKIPTAFVQFEVSTSWLLSSS